MKWADAEKSTCGQSDLPEANEGSPRMKKLAQPQLGMAATAVCVTLALLSIRPWGYAGVTGLVGDLFLCGVPLVGVLGMFWHGEVPRRVAAAPQPLRGLMYLATVGVGSVLVYRIEQVTIGGSRGATPFETFHLVLALVVNIWLMVVWGGWPFTLVKNRVVGGLALLVSSYTFAAMLLQAFDFSFLKHAPFYDGLDPMGPIAAWDGLVVSLTFLAWMFVFIHFDLAPLKTALPSMRQPTLGVAWTFSAGMLAWGSYFFGVRALGMQPHVFLVAVPMPFIVGSVVLLTMLEGSLTARLSGALKGFVGVVTAMALGTAITRLYSWLQPVITADVPPSNPVVGAMDQHLWLAASVLAVTLWFLNVYKDFFQFWPFAGRADAADEAAVVARARS